MSIVKKLSVVATFAVMIFANAGFAQNISDIIAVVSPAAWTTLRSDSVTVSILANTDYLADKQVNFRVIRRSGNRSTTLFNRNMKIENASSEIFLGRINQNDIPLGGNDFLSIEWSIQGDALKGTIEPVGVAIPSSPVVSDGANAALRELHLIAVKLADGIPTDEAASSLASGAEFEIAQTKFSAGWNSSGLFLRFVPTAQTENIEFALDMKNGKSAFLAWADRFIVYSADSVVGLRYGNRTAGGEQSATRGISRNEMQWGGGDLTLSRFDDARVIFVTWNELGVIPFDNRNIGFSISVKNRGRSAVNHPRTANRHIPGSWGDLRLQK